MIQLSSETEIFQFPVVVYLDKNTPREAPEVEGGPRVVPELCQNKNTEISVYTFDNQLQPVEAEIDFKCLDTTCDIGRTKIDGFDSLI